VICHVESVIVRVYVWTRRCFILHARCFRVDGSVFLFDRESLTTDRTGGATRLRWEPRARAIITDQTKGWFSHHIRRGRGRGRRATSALPLWAYLGARAGDIHSIQCELDCEVLPETPRRRDDRSFFAFWPTRLRIQRALPIIVSFPPHISQRARQAGPLHLLQWTEPHFCVSISSSMGSRSSSSCSRAVPLQTDARSGRWRRRGCMIVPLRGDGTRGL
jgi:hypothetical protein